MSKSYSIARGNYRSRGFLLLVVIGILAVLLGICVGFLSFARGEVESVAHLRDKADAEDMAHTAVDWMAGNLCAELFNGDDVDATKYVSNAKGAHWWYRPFEQNLSTWLQTKWLPSGAQPGWGFVPSYMDATKNEATWTYLPQDFFPEGGVVGRISVQVLDPNGMINLNDWLEDCNPTQCQMAHIFMDAFGEKDMEKYRKFRDTNNFDASVAPAPIRYHEAWRVVSGSRRQMWWPWHYKDTTTSGFLPKVADVLAKNWVTTNASWFSLGAAETDSVYANIAADCIPFYNINPQVGGPLKYYPSRLPTTGATAYAADTYPGSAIVSVAASDYCKGFTNNEANQFVCGFTPGLAGFSLRSYVDPDTGRSPVNVNTCYNSGERLPMNIHGGSPCYTMEGVFNVESLRRIIKVGQFYFKNSVGAVTPASGIATDPEYSKIDWSNATPTPDMRLARIKHEELRTQLAYQYQETLCRYFTGTYNHPATRKYPPIGGAADPSCGIGAASTDYSAPRFPMGLAAFRAKCRNDLIAMAVTTANGNGIVNFSNTDVPEVASGYLDQRVAEACYDNIVPGSASLGLPFTDLPPGQTVLKQLYDMRLARDEGRPNNTEMTAASPNTFEQAFINVHGYWDDSIGTETVSTVVYQRRDDGYRTFNTNLVAGAYEYTLTGAPAGTLPPTNSFTRSATGLYFKPKGMDIARDFLDSGAPVPDGPYKKRPKVGVTIVSGNPVPYTPNTKGVPERQLVFGPDWFSTELTTTTTNFLFVVNVQIVDKQSLLADPNNPRDVFWNQYVFSVELAADVLDETVGNVDWPNTGLGYYRGDGGGSWARRRKTDTNIVDANCATLTSTTVIDPHYDASWYGNNNIGSGNAAWHFTTPTAAMEWVDFRGVPPDMAKESAYYASSNQTKRHVYIRYITSLNQNISR